MFKVCKSLIYGFKIGWALILVLIWLEFLNQSPFRI